MKTTAVRTGDAWIINGVKDRVANAPLAKLFAVEVSSDANGASTLLVPRDTPGLSVRGERPQRALAPRRLRRAGIQGLPGAGGESCRQRR